MCKRLDTAIRVCNPRTARVADWHDSCIEGYTLYTGLNANASHSHSDTLAGARVADLSRRVKAFIFYIDLTYPWPRVMAT